MEPLSVTASVIAVATAASQSSKALFDLIKTYRDSVEIFGELEADIQGLSSILDSLQAMRHGDASLSPAQRKVLKATNAALKRCTNSLNDFKTKLEKELMSHSPAGDISKRDRLALHFKRNGIAAFRIRLKGYIETLMIALLATSIESSSKINMELAAKIDSVAGLFTGQMDGLKLAIQAIEDAGASSSFLIEEMKQNMEAISQCGDVCNAAAELVPVQGGATFRSVQAFNEARFVMGSTNTQAIAAGSTRVFGEVIGKDKTKIWMGDTDAETALKFMNAP